MEITRVEETVSVYRHVPAEVWEKTQEEAEQVLLGELYAELAKKKLMPIGITAADVRYTQTTEGSYYAVRMCTPTTAALIDYRQEMQ